MADMKHVSKRVVSVEDHAVTISLAEIHELAIQDDPARGAVPSHDVQVQVVLSASDAESREVLGRQAILDLAQSANPDIPNDAEVVIGLRWRTEQEIKATKPGVVAAPLPGQAAPAVQTVGQLGVDPALVVVCGTCGAVPALQGPTPDCVDASGCALVRARLGVMAVPTAVPSAQPTYYSGQPQQAAPAPPPVPPGRALNRETGEVAFVARDGSVYGKHDYIRDRLSARDL